MKKATESLDVFYAEDGTRFLTKQECTAHETAVAGRAHRAECTKFFEAYYQPDLTEGRGWYGWLFIASEDAYTSGDQETYALAAMVTAFGNPLAFVQGASPMSNWRLSPSTQHKFEKWREFKASVGDYKYSSTALFISDKPPVLGWPEPVRISDLLDKKIVDAAIIKAEGGR